MALISQDEVRTAVAAQRKALSQEDCALLSHKIIQQFLAIMPEDRLSGVDVGLYRAFGKELNLHELDHHLRARNCRVHYPRIESPHEKTMHFVEAGIKDPLPVADVPNRIKPMNLLFIPGVAFSPLGQRIGRGAGYYDRYLKLDRTAFRIALVYDFQLVDPFESHPWDEPVHWIISEKRVIRLKDLA